MIRPFIAVASFIWILLACAAGQALADLSEPIPEETLVQGKVAAGYRIVSSSGDPQRAKEYSLLESSPTAGAEFSWYQKHRHFSLSANYLNESEYQGETQFDYRGLLRLDLGTESMFHNLDHIPYDAENRPDPGRSVSFEDHNPGDDYGIEVRTSRAKLRLKHPELPAHVNLGYWRLERSGQQQLRFTDEGHGTGVDPTTCVRCHSQSRTRDIDQVTQEVTAGADAHLGPVDINLEGLYREFRDEEGIPVDEFGSHATRTGPANRQHDEAPDSRLTKATVSMHSSMSGGLTGAAAFSIGEMENQSKLDDVRPVEAETDFYQVAGDASWLFNPRWTLNLRYRLTDLDSSNSGSITADGTIVTEPPGGPAEVRPTIDLTRASCEAGLTFRPSPRVSIKGEFRRLEIERSDTGGPVDFQVDYPNGIITQPDLTWELPDEENRNRWRLTVHARPFGHGRLKLKGRYTYETSEDPAYGTSFDDRQEIFGNFTWIFGPRWGIQGSGRYNYEHNDGQELFLPEPTVGFLRFDRERTNRNTNLAGSLWITPHESLTLSLNYAFLRTRITQDLIFGGQPSEADPLVNFAIEDEDVYYHQRVHSTSLLVAWRMLESLNWTAEGRYIDSYAAFDPDFFVQNLQFFGGSLIANASSSGLNELTELDIRQIGFSLGATWNATEHLECSARYGYDKYQDEHTKEFDGSAQTYLLNLAYVW